MSNNLRLVGCLEGHDDMVTSIATSLETPNVIATASRDKTVITWVLEQDDEKPGFAHKRLTGHNGAVTQVVYSADGSFCLTSSWDKTLRLWDVATGKCVRIFKGHSSDVFSVAFSADNRQIVSAGRDKSIKLWNTLAEMKYTVDSAHHDWISTVVFSPSAKSPTVISASWDKTLKVYNLADMTLKHTLIDHTAPVYAVDVSPDGSLCASGAKDQSIILWDVVEGKKLYALEAGAPVNAVAFSPKNYWIVAATDNAIVLWDLENKAVIDTITDSEGSSKAGMPWVVSISWSAAGEKLFAGRSDGTIMVFDVQEF